MSKNKPKLRSHLARAAAIGFAGFTAVLVVGAGVASAAPADPPGGATPLAPHFYNGNVEAIRGSGSDTTFFMMQRISDLYTGAGLYGCTLNADTGANYNTSDPAPSTSNEEFFCQVNDNIATTDVNDNWDRTEVYEGVDDVGSGAGQGQLCGSTDTPLTVDFARSSKPAGSITGCAMTETGYAKDGVPIIAYPVNPTQFGTSTTAPYSSINGGVVGPVALGWLPGDPAGGPYTGTKLTNLSNADNGGGAGSTAYRLWCGSGSTQITDWGALTNLGPSLLITGATVTSGSPTVTITGSFPSTVLSGDAVTGTDVPSGTTINSVSGGSATLSNNASGSGTVNLTVTTATKLAVGQGAPIGVPIRLLGVNTSSGTESTFQLYAESGVSGLGCSSNADGNAANDPNPATAPSPNSAHIALENNSDQIDQFAISDFPSPDYVDQAIEAATTLYFESNGVFNTNPYAATTTINGVGFSGFKVNENGQSTTTPNLLNNVYPTARTLFNIYNANTVRASTGGFLNWICDGNTNFSKGLDNSTGANFDNELNNLIGTTFGFPRLTDESAAATTTEPADNQPAPNQTCAASLAVNTTSGSDTISLASGTFPPDIVNSGGLVAGASVGIVNANFPAGTTVVSGAGTATLTLSNTATATGTAVSTTFEGVPAVTTVASTQN
jgi:hypothetical protein